MSTVLLFSIRWKYILGLASCPYGNSNFYRLKWGFFFSHIWVGDEQIWSVVNPASFSVPLCLKKALQLASPLYLHPLTTPSGSLYKHPQPPSPPHNNIRHGQRMALINIQSYANQSSIPILSSLSIYSYLTPLTPYAKHLDTLQLCLTSNMPK